MSLSAKAFYARFLAARPGRLHFAAHSHHPWPDVTRDAVLACWDDAARLADRKWEHIFGTVVPKAQGHVARILDLSTPRQIAFAPSVHELLCRLFSCFDDEKPVRILTTDSEFHSLARQLNRWEESPRVAAVRVPAAPFASFEERFREAAAGAAFDLVYLSHVFFNSGYVVQDLPRIVSSVRDEATLVVVDGYHAFCALPTSLRRIEDRAFYLGGGYKYAQAGEGACFLHVPRGCRLRPANTGWFATFGTLTQAQPAGVPYPDDGFRFWGATYDPAALYRLNAVHDLYERNGITVPTLHVHVRALQERFLEGLERRAPRALPLASLVTGTDLSRQGHFLVFDLPAAQDLWLRLAERGVELDVRGTRLRFGFGVYQDDSDVDRLLDALGDL